MFRSAWSGGDAEEIADMERMWTDMMKQASMEAGSLGGLEGEPGAPWGAGLQQQQLQSPLEAPYELTKDNPYAASRSAFEDGMRLFGEGRLGEATMAFHAVVEADPAHADAWHMLGIVHQENDEDKKAILCLERAVENDAYHLDALLALGVSYVNELDLNLALRTLKAWIVNNSAFSGLQVKEDAYSDGSLMDEVMNLMLQAAKYAPANTDVAEVLGVLYNVSRDYMSAVQEFKRAIGAKPDSWTLWNRLGATYANGHLGPEAVPCYLRALELRPAYARALLNLGISYSNSGDYSAAIKAYLDALRSSPDALHVYGYIRIALTAMNRFDLVPLADRSDLEGLRRAFGV